MTLRRYDGSYRPPRQTLMGALAAFGVRRMVRLAQWRALAQARREARAAPGHPSEQVFRGFIQINMIRPH